MILKLDRLEADDLNVRSIMDERKALASIPSSLDTDLPQYLSADPYYIPLKSRIILGNVLP